MRSLLAPKSFLSTQSATHSPTTKASAQKVSFHLTNLGVEEKKAEPAPEVAKKKAKAKGKAISVKEDGAFNTYIYRVLQEVTPDSSISKKAMSTLNQMMADKFDKIMCEARDLCNHTKKSTIGSREVESAVKLLVPGELGKHAVTQGKRALRNYA